MKPPPDEDFMQFPRTPSKLSDSIHRQLSSYALAATAAGVGVMALGQSAEARIVYTPAHVSIVGPHGSYPLDLNHDKVTDFTISNTTNYNTDQAFWNLFENGAQGNAVVGTFVYQGFPPKARAIDRGVRIGRNGGPFYQGVAKLASFYSGGGGYSANGNWVNVQNRYLGLKFQIKGRTHYGWARLTVQVLTRPVRIDAALTGYAYETVPNKPIIASQPKLEFSCNQIEVLSALKFLGFLARPPKKLNSWG